MNTVNSSAVWFTREGQRAREIVSAVAEFYGYAEVLIIGRRRPAQLAQARLVAMYLVREHTALSYPEIGHLFGRDHSTIIHAHNRIRQLITHDKRVARSVEMITTQIEPRTPAA
jgi:chromosomal replication initiator protein